MVLLNVISCGDDGPNCPGNISLPLWVSPYKPYYSIGDTIIISSRFHKLIYDSKTEKYYDASTYKFSPTVSIEYIDSANIPFKGSQIENIADYMKEDNSGMNYLRVENRSSIAGEYGLRQDTINFSIRLRLKVPGAFWISTSSLSSGDSHLQNNFYFGCRGRQITFYLMSPKESNIYLMQNLRSIYPNDYILSDSIHRFYNRAGYCFEVR